MKNLIYLFLLLISLTSCKKDRTEYLSQDQKDVIDAFKIGDRFTMLKTAKRDNILFIDTLIFEVTESGYWISSDGRWYENLGPDTWTEIGYVIFKTIKGPYEDGSINVSGDAINSISLDIGGIYTLKYEKKRTVKVNNKIYNNVFIGILDYTQTTDSSYFSINDGIIKLWNTTTTYLKID